MGGYRAQRMDLQLNLSQFASDEFYGCWHRAVPLPESIWGVQLTTVQRSSSVMHKEDRQ